MLLVLWLLVQLPALAYALRPRDGAVLAPVRLAVVRAALVLGAYAVAVVEAATLATALTRTTIAVAWAVATAAVIAAVLVRCVRDLAPEGGRRGQPLDALREELRSRRGATRRTWRRTKSAAAAAPAWQWVIACVVAILAVSVAVLAIGSSPNNFDSQTYHLPRIEHWVQNAGAAVYPTAIHRQVDLGPGAEYLLTHLRLVSGGDGAYHLLQYFAGVGAALAASRIAAQLGGGPVAQLATVFLLATTPEVLLQASSTQVDLVAAAWVACLATVVLDEFTRPGDAAGAGTAVLRAAAPHSDALYLGLALGLIAVTKTTGLLAAAPLLLIWGIGRLVRDGRRRRPCLCGRSPGRCSRADGSRAWQSRAATVAASLAVLALALVLVGPFLWRMQQTFGHPLGPDMLRESIGVQTADPRLLLVNALRIAQTGLDTPLPFLSDAFAALVNGLASLMGVDVNDPRITFGSTEFPVPAWYPDEDRAAFPLTGLATLAGVIWFAVKGPGLRRAYAAALVFAFIGVACTVSWQPWVNRLVMFLVVLGAPAAGLLAASLVRSVARSLAERRRRRVAIAFVTAVAVVASLAGVLTVAYGFPRRLAGTWSVFTLTDLEERFVRRLEWLPQYEEAAAAVAAREPERIGVVQGNDSWEYPWWVLFRDEVEDGMAIVALQSVVPGEEPADPASVDAIVCAEDLDECRGLTPEGWEFHDLGTVAYALPPQA
ncbi:hypothetical protein K3N28_13365 [Glycomyces sp. TRM65418]|uniref:hypothetical protein n=1 Tax=Glycomyces sp. TRM65418 TaxID=2867006 RepID=UPI001CE6485B|nr:hypothetical protein [Glycomyces sp. TRM65418]MCC3764054.1 hypothetical protein [Glycomyces sp. TRM65418]QZD53745.1 hypothetical protein K3N28_13300 [Glycomyces sp. TRM65418]